MLRPENTRSIQGGVHQHSVPTSDARSINKYDLGWQSISHQNSPPNGESSLQETIKNIRGAPPIHQTNPA